jgi:hypothetical protein
VDSFSYSSEDVLNDLDPLSRALLDLSVQRGMDDADIAQVLGTDEASVFEVRVGLLRNLAEKVAPEHADAELPELEAAVAERLYPEEATGEAEIAEDQEPADAAPEATAAEDETAVEADDLGDEVDEAELDETPTQAEPELAEPEDEVAALPVRSAPAARPRESRRRSLLPILLPILLLLAVVAVIVAVGTNDGDSEKSGGATTQAQPDQPTTAKEPEQQPKPDAKKPKPTRLTTLGSSSAKGSATLENGRLTLTLRNLPPANGGTYTLWLFDNVIDAQELKTVKNGKATVKLPKDADQYEFLDVSVEPKDGNPNHSGQSVLRVPLEKLGKTAG